MTGFLRNHRFFQVDNVPEDPNQPVKYGIPTSLLEGGFSVIPNTALVYVVDGRNEYRIATPPEKDAAEALIRSKSTPPVLAIRARPLRDD